MWRCSKASNCPAYADLKEDPIITARHKTIIYIVVAIFIAALVFVRSNGPEAVVNGEPIDSAKLKKTLEARIKANKESGTLVNEDLLRNAIIEQMITQILIEQGARESGVTVSDEEVLAQVEAVRERHGAEVFAKYLLDNGYSEQQYHDFIKSRMIKDRFVDTVILKEAFTDEVLLEHYNNMDEPYMTPESVELRIVEFPDFDTASNAVAEMHTKGFDPVANWLERTKGAFVSEYIEAEPSVYPGQLGKAMRELEEGTFGGPYKGQDGFYIIRVKSRKPESPKTFEEARDEIRERLIKRDRASAVVKWVAKKRDDSDIERR